jgi:hypothetical protein
MKLILNDQIGWTEEWSLLSLNRRQWAFSWMHAATSAFFGLEFFSSRSQISMALTTTRNPTEKRTHLSLPRQLSELVHRSDDQPRNETINFLVNHNNGKTLSHRQAL